MASVNSYLAIGACAFLFLVLLGPSVWLCEAGNVIYHGCTIYPGEYLNYQDYQLTLQHDCNLVLTDGRNVVWATNTTASVCYCTLEKTGELVVYDGARKRLWGTNKTGVYGNYVFLLQKNRNLVVVGPPKWSSRTSIAIVGPRRATDPDMRSENVLIRGDVLYPGNSLKNGIWELRMQSDCNLVLYENGNKAIWATNTGGKVDACYLKMQDDGDLVLFDGTGKRLWATNTVNPSGGYNIFILENDRTMVVYGPGLWHAASWKLGAATI